MTREEFDQLRPSEFAIAYRMLGSVSEAEDVVQEGFLRLHPDKLRHLGPVSDLGALLRRRAKCSRSQARAGSRPLRSPCGRS